jgi:hypothetical protein
MAPLTKFELNRVEYLSTLSNLLRGLFYCSTHLILKSINMDGHIFSKKFPENCGSILGGFST